MFDSPQKIKHQRRRKIPRASERLTGKKQKRQRYHAEG